MDINELDARAKKFLIQFCREGLMYGEEGNVSTLFKLLIERGFVESSYKGFRLVFYPTKKLCEVCNAWDESAIDCEIAREDRELEQRIASMDTGVDWGIL